MLVRAAHLVRGVQLIGAGGLPLPAHLALVSSNRADHRCSVAFGFPTPHPLGRVLGVSGGVQGRERNTEQHSQGTSLPSRFCGITPSASLGTVLPRGLRTGSNPGTFRLREPLSSCPFSRWKSGVAGRLADGEVKEGRETSRSENIDEV